MLEQTVAFNEIKKDMIEHGVNFDGRMDNDKTGLCTVRDCVKCILLSGDTNGELCYVENGIKYNVTIKVKVLDQIIKISKNTEVKLSYLRRMHRENNFAGQCVVFFDPELFSIVIEIPGFRHVDDYKYTRPVHENEIGGVEVFHMVPASPIKYNVDII